MIYVNAMLVLTIAYLVTKLTIEHREMRQGKNTRVGMKKA